MAYRLMAADYDLTLTGSDRKVSAHTRETIRAVYAAGKFVTLASGRLGGSAEVARELFPGDVPLILGNGGLVQSCTTGKTLSETMMDEPTALTMLRWCRRRANAAIVYGRSGIYTDRVNAASRDVRAALLEHAAAAALPRRGRTRGDIQDPAARSAADGTARGEKKAAQRAAAAGGLLLRPARKRWRSCQRASTRPRVSRAWRRSSAYRARRPSPSATGKTTFPCSAGRARHRHGERARERESRGGRHRARL